MDAIKDLKAFILVVVILAFVWLFTSGPLRPNAKSGWFLFKPQQKQSERAQKQLPLDEKITARASSSLVGIKKEEPADVLVLKRAKAKETDLNEEYIEISAPSKNKSPYRLTGLVVESRNGFDIAIGQGAKFYFSEVAEQPQEDIYLKPGEKVIITTGSSPLGTNFQLNKCSGYFEQHHDFVPKIPLHCPLPEEENLLDNLNDQCLDFIEDLPRCKMVLSIPPNLSSFCNEYINDKINYKTCSEVHKYDDDFYEPEWRVYLDRPEEMWKQSRETIILKNSSGKIIDSISY